MQLESILSFGVAAIAVIVAIWSALEARTANRKAAEANRISKEALDLQRLHSPAPWSELQKVGKNNYQITNQSGRDIQILEVLSHPVEASGLLFAENLPILVSNGDRYQLMIVGVMGSGVEAIEIIWSYTEDPSQERHHTHRNVN